MGEPTLRRQRPHVGAILLYMVYAVMIYGDDNANHDADDDFCRQTFNQYTT